MKSEARQIHGAESWLVSYAFFDGSGAIALSKVQAEPDGEDARWVGSGRTVLNNKGNPVKQYEPYFSASWDWETEEVLEGVGVTPIFYYDSLGRLMRTELPNGTLRRALFTPWRMEAWDENDTVADADHLWYAARQPTSDPELSDQEQRAATLTWAHRKTPTVTHFDNLGRPFLVQQYLKAFDALSLPADEDKLLETRTVLDLEGQVREVQDALGRTCMSYLYAVDGQILKQASIDAGDKWALSNVVGAPFRAWDALEHRIRVEVDTLQRPTHVWVKKGTGDEGLATRVYYGEAFADPEDANLRGKAVLTFDGAGLVETSSFDFKGNALTWARRLATAYLAEPEWSVVATEDAADAKTTASSLLESETWEKAFAYDALGRVTSAIMPDDSELLPSYNEAGLLDGVDVKVRGASTATTFVDDINYDAHGRRTRIAYGNNTATEYFYDELTFRLTRIKTTRSTDSKILQDLKYTYDPVGNIVEVHDDAHEDVFYNDAQVTPTGQFVYDALYRLVQASGREHAGSVGDDQRDQNDLPLWNLPHPNSAAALRRYNEEYTYDKVGNFLAFFHEGVGGPSSATWTRTYRYGSGLTSGYADNRLHSTSVPGPAWASYSHDANGNMTAMPHLAEIEHTHRDQMRHADLGGGGDAYYTYDGGGERVRKLIVRTGTTTEERIYLGGWEIYRKRVGSGHAIEVERETLHVMDDARRIAMIETLTVDDGDVVSTPVPRVRYQYGNHLDSAMLECDGDGAVISYEEYHPYGTAAYRSAKSGVEVSERRYRYTGKERDEETGFQYHSARYLAPWLGRWTSADPAGMVDGLGLYNCVRGNPVKLADPSGLQGAAPSGPKVRSADDAYKAGLKASVKLREARVLYQGALVNLEIAKKEHGDDSSEVFGALQLVSQAKELETNALRAQRQSAEEVAAQLKSSLRFDHANATHHIANILQAAWDDGVTDRAQVAYIVATADHESKTGKDMIESEDQARLFGYPVKYRGRGYGHLTREGNYERFGKIFGVDLVKNPELAADEKLAARIIVNQLTVTASRPVTRGKKKVWQTLVDFKVKEGGTEDELVIGWIEARAMHNTMNDEERERARPIKNVAQKIFKLLGGVYAKK